MIQPLVQELLSTCVLGFGPLLAKPRIRLDRNLVCELLLSSGNVHYVHIFRSIALAVTKRTLLTDDGRWRRRRTPRIGFPRVSQTSTLFVHTVYFWHAPQSPDQTSSLSLQVVHCRSRLIAKNKWFRNLILRISDNRPCITSKFGPHGFTHVLCKSMQNGSIRNLSVARVLTFYVNNFCMLCMFVVSGSFSKMYETRNFCFSFLVTKQRCICSSD
jgi:hypothetical protein